MELGTPKTILLSFWVPTSTTSGKQGPGIGSKGFRV